MARISTTPDFSREEVGLALRNPGMQLEALRYPITPIGMHNLLIHFDVPQVDSSIYELPVTGRIRNPLKLSLEDIRKRPKVTLPVMMECGGNGRAHLSPRPVSAPWHEEAVGCAAGKFTIEGRAWSGFGPVERVEFSADGGETWHDAVLGDAAARYGWTSWSREWDARPGEHELCVRATDSSGKPNH